MTRAALLAAILALAPSLAAAQPSTSYLPESDIATAQARSAQQCAAMGCRPPTLYWWSALSLPCTAGGTAWVEIQAGGDYGPARLSSGEISALVPWATMSGNGCFPVPEPMR